MIRRDFVFQYVVNNEFIKIDKNIPRDVQVLLFHNCRHVDSICADTIANTFQQLEKLVIISCPILDDGIKQLGQSQSITDLHLEAIASDDGELKALIGHHDYQALRSFQILPIEPNDVTPLRFFPALQRLKLGVIKITDEGMAALGLHPTLKHLTFYLVSGFTLAGITELSKSTSIETLIFDLMILDNGFTEISTMSSLKTLYINRTNPLPVETKELINSKSLTSLQVDYCWFPKENRELWDMSIKEFNQNVMAPYKEVLMKALPKFPSVLLDIILSMVDYGYRQRIIVK